jgi:hypothetical protein
MQLRELRDALLREAGAPLKQYLSRDWVYLSYCSYLYSLVVFIYTYIYKIIIPYCSYFYKYIHQKKRLYCRIRVSILN